MKPCMEHGGGGMLSGSQAPALWCTDGYSARRPPTQGGSSPVCAGHPMPTPSPWCPGTSLSHEKELCERGVSCPAARHLRPSSSSGSLRANTHAGTVHDQQAKPCMGLAELFLGFHLLKVPHKKKPHLFLGDEAAHRPGRAAAQQELDLQPPLVFHLVGVAF